MYFFNFGDFHVVGSSPEVLVRVEEGLVTVRPIAGTRPRGANEEADLALEQDLLSDARLAEHLMLIDLGRNDVGRVAQTGTVRLTEDGHRALFECHAHRFQRHRPAQGAPDGDGRAARDPAGRHALGAPKIRAMEIIDELEPVKRGVYGGAVGYLAERQHGYRHRHPYRGDQDGELHVQAGAGIVADSQPALEWEETLNKRRAMFRAVALAERDEQEN